MHHGFQWPPRVYSSHHVIDKDRIEVRGHHLANLLLDNSGAKRIRTADLEYVGHAAKQLRHELVPREHKGQSLGVIQPNLVAHHSERRQTAVLERVHEELILWFFGFWFHKARAGHSGFVRVVPRSHYRSIGRADWRE